MKNLLFNEVESTVLDVLSFLTDKSFPPEGDFVVLAKHDGFFNDSVTIYDHIVHAFLDHFLGENILKPPEYFKLCFFEFAIFDVNLITLDPV